LNKLNYDKLDILVEKAMAAGLNGIGFSPADVDSESFTRVGIGNERIAALKQSLLPSTQAIDTFLANFKPGQIYHDLIQRYSNSEILQWSTGDIRRCLLFYKDVLQNRSRTFDADPCHFPQFSMLLDYDGSLKNCFYSQAFGHLDRLDQADWSFQESLAALKDSGKCKTCRGKIFCDQAQYAA
jgi:hypothetical protein